MDKILAAQPPPPKQKHFNIATMKTEQMKPDGTFYEPGEDRPPMIKCTEWTVNQAIPALYASGVLTKWLWIQFGLRRDFGNRNLGTDYAMAFRGS
ncbi:hypothetical protein LSUB1_G003956 [Lachnellula subtilissima]|uniref:Uncharacterized protein n=1 Tax=Lachnellula subtilissima TaxID=602034 RepID=A0A8H8U9N8_9HELO|nr:hypothetical protein LSUB1_G003956 [Lachnellula subtilissima]